MRYINFKKIIRVFILLNCLLASPVFSLDTDGRLQESSTPIRLVYNENLFLMGSGEHETALKGLKNIIRENPDFFPAYQKIIYLNEISGKTEETFNFLRNIEDNNPEQAGPLFGIGSYYQNMENYNKAADYFQKAIRCSPVHIENYIPFGDCLKETGRLSEGCTFLEKTGAEHSVNAELCFGLGYLAQLQQDWQKALSYYDQVLKENPLFTIVYIQKAICLYRSGQIKKAPPVIKRAIFLAQSQHLLEEEANAWNILGVCMNMQGQIREVITNFEKAVSLYKKIGQEDHKQAVQTNLGMLLNRLGKYQQAKQALSDCIDYFSRKQDSTMLNHCLGNLGWVFMNQSLNDSAFFYFDRAASMAEASRDTLFAAYWHRFIGLIKRKQADLEGALSAYNKSLKFAEAVGDLSEMGRNYNSAGRILLEIGKIDSARNFFKRALYLHKKTGDKIFEAFCLDNMAAAYTESGNYSKALKFFEQAYQIVKDSGDKKDEIRLLGDIGVVYSALGDRKKAIETYQKTYRLALEINAKDVQGIALHNIGEEYINLNQPDSARFYILKSIKLAHKTSDKICEIKRIKGLAKTYSMKGQFELADSLLQIVLKKIIEFDQHYLTPVVLNQMSKLYVKTGKIVLAEKYALKSLHIARQMNNPENIGNANLQLGRISLLNDSLKNARDYFLEAVESIEDLRKAVSGVSHKITYLKVRTKPYRELIHTFSLLHKEFPAENYGYRAFQTAELVKARTLRDIMAQNQDGLFRDIPIGILVKQKKAKDRLKETQSALSLQAAEFDADPALLDSLNVRVIKARKQLTNIEQKIERNSEFGYLLNSNPPRLSIKKIQNQLPNSSVLLEYAVGREQSYLFVVRPETFHLIEIPVNDAALQSQIRKIITPFLNVTDAGRIRYDLSIAHKLYNLLIKPAEPFIHPDETLIIIPDGALYYLSFEALVTRFNSEGNSQVTIFDKQQEINYLIKEHPVIYNTSAGVWLSCLLDKPKKISGQGNLLALGNPLYYGTGKDQVGLRSNRGWNFQSLPYSGKEARVIGTMFQNSRVLIGAAATEEAVKSEARNYRILHLSVHGLMDERQPLYSGLVLSQDNDDKEDGFLQTYEILNLNLNADLVTLSGCETGLGQLVKGEGMVGLYRAFLSAGARSLVVSLWNVSDQSTAELMIDFYGNLKAGMHKPHALREAKLTLMKKTVNIEGKNISYGHPLFWAPFIMIGDSMPLYHDSPPGLQLWWLMVFLFILLLVGLIIKKRQHQGKP